VAWPSGAGGAAHVFVARLDDVLTVTGDDGHHLSRVLRLEPGETVTAADGAGTWRAYTVTGVGPHDLSLAATGGAVTETPPARRTAVAFALTKGDKPERVVQKLTELGVDRILPVIAQRSISRPDERKAAVVVERWRRVALEAARQCRRSRLPEVAELAPLRSIAGHPALAVAELGGRAPSRLGPPPGDEVLVVVGPEGGWAPGEVEGLSPWARIGLGPFVLRAETAALAAATLVRSGAFEPEPD
jgi:16S rRNA (uracil1498-N3)-methyltransferase